MPKHNFISIIFFLMLGFITKNSSVASDEENEEVLESIKQWTPSHLHNSHAQSKIAELIKSEGYIKIENTPGDQGDYGYSFPQVNAAQRDYLQSIKKIMKAHKSAQRPLMWELVMD